MPTPRLLAAKKLKNLTQPEPHPLLVLFPAPLWRRLAPLRERGLRVAPLLRRLLVQFLDSDAQGLLCEADPESKREAPAAEVERTLEQIAAAEEQEQREICGCETCTSQDPEKRRS